MSYTYTLKTARNLPLSNRLVVASRLLSTVGDVNVFCAPPFFPHMRPVHKAYWEPIGDQAKPLFLRLVYKGREIRYHEPESTITPWSVESRTKWADTTAWWHPEGLLLDSVCFCPSGHAGYILKLILTNKSSNPIDIDVILGGSHQRAEESSEDAGAMTYGFPGGDMAVAARGFCFQPSTFEEMCDLPVVLSADRRVGSGYGYYLATKTLTVPPEGSSEIIAGGMIGVEGDGCSGVLHHLLDLLGDVDAQLAGTEDAWRRQLALAPKIECPDEDASRMFDWAWVNLDLLERENRNCTWLPGVEYTTLLALPLIYCWDHLYTSMVQSLYKPRVARNVLLEFLRHQSDDGFIPGEIDCDGKDGHMFSQCHALYALAMWNYLCVSADIGILDEVEGGKSVYERLVLAFDWYNRGGACITCFRDGVILPEFTRPVIDFHHKEDGLIWTTGFGDTGWDTADYRGFNNEWVDLNTYLYQGLRAMADIASLRGDDRRCVAYSTWAEKVKESINRLMWNPADEFYYDLKTDHSRMDVVTAGGLLPVLTDIPSPCQVDGIVRKILDPRHFWRPYGIPCLSVSHPRYDPRQYFWLGSCPPQIQNTIILGLYQHQRAPLAEQVWKKLLSAYHKSDGGPRFFCETYDADTGEGQWSENYNWTTMMVLPLVYGMAGLKATPCSLHFEPQLPAGWPGLTLRNLWLHGRRCDVTVSSSGCVELAGSA